MSRLCAGGVAVLFLASSAATSAQTASGAFKTQPEGSITLGTLDFWLPAKDATITGGTLTGDAAVLDVEGVLASAVKALALVRLIKGPSGWLFDSATMAGMLR